MTALKTGERMVPEQYRSEADYILYLRHLFAYETAAGRFRSSDLVLDIGCGEGYGTHLLAERVGRAVGVDVSSDAVTDAYAAYASGACNFLVYDGVRLPFEDLQFDAATSFQTIEHVKDDAGFIAEAARVLKRGAQFILTTPNRATRLKPGQRPWNRFHVREYSSSDLQALLLTKFSEVDVLGVRANERIEKIEQARVTAAQRLEALDPFGIRRRFPATVAALFARLKRTEASRSWTHRVEDFCATPASRDIGCDLLAICRR